MSFTDQVWQRIEPVRNAISRHPFVCALADGSLELETFHEYLRQDALYLIDYSRALSALAAGASDADEVTFWSGCAHQTMVDERSLHASHVDVLEGAIMNPTCRAYMSFLLASTHAETQGVGIAAVLPCFWLYDFVGHRLREGVHSEGELDAHPYGDWIRTYTGPEFEEATRRAKDYADQYAQASDDAGRERMAKAFEVASRYEWMFFDAASTGQQWPL